MDGSLTDVRDFLAKYPPFEGLPAEVREALPHHLEVRELAANTRVLALKEPVHHLYLVRSGRIAVHGPTGDLWALRTEGETFGVRALLGDGRAGFEATTTEGSTLYLLPEREFARLRLEHAEFERFFTPLGGGGSRLPRADDRYSAETQPNLIALRIGDLMTPDPAAIESDRPIREAAQMMRDRHISCLPVTTAGELAGIVTNVDLRDRVVAEGLPPDTPVAAVMTKQPITLDADLLAYDAFLTMRRRTVRHIPVLRQGMLVGIVTNTDVWRRWIDHPSYLSGNILRRNTPASLAQIVAQIPQLLTLLVETGEPAHKVGLTVSSIADVTTYRLLQLAEERLGPPPVPYVWLASGSQARQEQTGVSDQDNCLILDDAFDEQSHGAYFTELARFVCDGLDACGYVYCPGEMMAITAKWRQPLARWKQYFASWMDEPEPMAQMLASVMFDLRPIRGTTRLFDDLQAFTLEKAKANTLFVAHMATNALSHAPPLGFLGRVALIRGGEHRDQIDLKLQGIVPIVDLARLYALEAGVGLANTRDRLVAARQAGVLSATGARDLIDALEFLSIVRLRHQSERIRGGQAPDNFISLQELSRIERQHLRDAFLIVRTMQSSLSSSHQIRR
jgi:Predicted signal-transduction protein containing cAMP-binding and CBS domains